PARARRRRQEPRVRRQDLPAVLRGPGETAMLTPRRTTSIICAALYLAAAAPVRAELDPGLNTPYRLRVFLNVADHRSLTSTFQKQLEHELRAHLRLTYGKLATVDVVRAPPLLKDVRAKGLQALDGWEELSDFKTHFVLIDYADGQYRINARQ